MVDTFIKVYKSKMTESVENFVAKLQTTISVSVVTIDERLTSFAAEENLRECNMSTKKMKKYVDIEAARLILEKCPSSTTTRAVLF